MGKGVTTVRRISLVAVGVTMSVTMAARADVCILPDNGSGTVNLPPACSTGYISPEDFHLILDGLPPNTTIRVRLAHRQFTNIVRTPCLAEDPECFFPGGQIETFNSQLFMNLTGTGSLGTFSHSILISNATCETQVGQRNPNEIVQEAPAEIVALSGNASTFDLNFTQFNVRAGRDFGLPSPGEVKLALIRNGTCQGGANDGQLCASDANCPDSVVNGICVGGANNGLACTSNTNCPGGACFNDGLCVCPGGCNPQYHVNSYFDVNYTIAYTGRAGRPTAGLSGLATGEIRMRTGAIPTLTMRENLPGATPAGTSTSRHIDLVPGETFTVSTHAFDFSPNDLVAYQVTLPECAIPLPGAQGTVCHNDQNPIINTTRSDYVFFGFNPAPLATPFVQGGRPGVVAIFLTVPPSPPVLDHNLKYLGDFTYVASLNAAGDFLLPYHNPGIESSSATIVSNSAFEPFPVSPFGAVLHFPPAVCVDEDCAFLDDVCHVGLCNENDECEAFPLEDGTPCDDGDSCTDNDSCQDGTCAGTPIDDIAPGLVHGTGAAGETQPCTGLVDPRWESSGGGLLNQGIDRVTMVFTEAVFSPGGGDPVLGDFSVTETGAGPAPTVTAVNKINDTTYEVVLSRIIRLQQWTTIIANVVDACGNPIANFGDLGAGNAEPDRIDIGFLPGDINQNRTVEPVDLTRMRQFIVSQSFHNSCEDVFYFDTNRNGVAPEPVDLTRYRALILGGGASTQVWQGAGIATQP